MLFSDTVVLILHFNVNVFLLQRTPMEAAAERGHKDIVHYLRDANSDVNIRL